MNLNFLDLIKLFVPEILAIVQPNLAGALNPYIVNGIDVAEQAGAKAKASGQPMTGADKLQLALNESVNGAAAAQAVDPTRVNVAKVSATISAVVNSANKVIQVVKDAKDQTAQTLPEPPAFPATSTDAPAPSAPTPGVSDPTPSTNTPPATT